MRKFAVGSALLLCALGLLQGCSSKPPGCADQETVGLIRSMVLKELRGQVAAAVHATNDQADKSRIEQLGEGFASDLKVEIINIVSNGYDEGAKKYTCAGELSAIPTLTGQGLKFPAVYTTQRTADDKARFLIEVERLRPFVDRLTGPPFARYIEAKTKADAEAKAAKAVPQAPSKPAEIAPAPVEAPTPSVAADPTPIQAPPPPVAPAPASVSPPTSRGPSFDCTKASMASERLICANQELAGADQDMAESYRAAVSRSANPEIGNSLKTTQSTWRKAERDACADASCMLAAYKKRQAYLDGVR